MITVQIIIFILGLILVFFTLLSAVRTFILPRSAPDIISLFVFKTIRKFFEFSVSRTQDYLRRDAIMAFYAPISLLTLLPTWLILVSIGYAAMYWASGIQSWKLAYTISGSSLLTLGFAKGDTMIQTLLEFSEATIGLILVALLIAYLPTMYAAFSKREVAVNLLSVRAGTPPSPIEMLLRFNRIHTLDQLNEQWRAWERWFAEVEESHTSLSALVFFRSPEPNHSWVTASGTILDSASLTLSAIDTPWDPQAALCIRAGYLALRKIADYFHVDYNPYPSFPEEPISVTRTEFVAACDRMREQNIPIKPDIDQAWLDFAGWRVNYDKVLIALSRLTMAPKTMWSSDRLTD
ncbi:MAG: hypothetical protein PVG14_09395 [Anaerolineales bacterium]|jgi:hypothetical protein